MRCGKHALNNALALAGSDRFTNAMLSSACDVEIAESLVPDEYGIVSDPQRRPDHEGAGGWYSDKVLMQALRRTFTFELQLGRQLRLDANLLQEQRIVGAIMNMDNVHWVALRYVDRNYWLLDSRYQPRLLSESQYLALIAGFEHTYAIRDLRR